MQWICVMNCWIALHDCNALDKVNGLIIIIIGYRDEMFVRVCCCCCRLLFLCALKAFGGITNCDSQSKEILANVVVHWTLPTMPYHLLLWSVFVCSAQAELLNCVFCSSKWYGMATHTHTHSIVAQSFGIQYCIPVYSVIEI